MEMDRVQVLLPHDEREALKHEADRLGLSMSEVVRRALRVVLPSAADTAAENDDGIDDGIDESDPFYSIIGSVTSGVPDLALNHDHYLYGAPKKA